MFNQCTIEGRLVADVRKSNTTNGTKAVTFSVANARSNKSTLFFNCVAYGTTAEFIAKYFKKGSPVIVSGPLEYYDTERDGKKYRNYQIIAVTCDFPVSNKDHAADNDHAADSAESTDNDW